MKKIICLITLTAVLLVFSHAMAAEKTKKEAAGTKKTVKSTAKAAKDIKAAEKETAENNDEEITASYGAKTKTEASSTAMANDGENADTGEVKTDEKKKAILFSMSTRSRIDVEKEKRLNEMLFLEKISNKYFKIYEDEDNYTVISKLPYAESDTDVKFNFKNENLLIINFKSKKDPEKEPIRYEITLPKPTAMEARKLLTNGALELVIPIDFFYDERNGMRK